MSYTSLITDPKAKKPRSNLTVRIDLENEDHALEIADELEDLARKFERSKKYKPYCWAEELAGLIRNE